MGAVKSVIIEIARFEEAGQLTEKPWSRETMTFNAVTLGRHGDVKANP